MNPSETPTGRTSLLNRLRQPVGAGRSTMVGGLPQVSLLPAEVRDAGNIVHHRRKVIAVVVLAAVVGAAGIVVAEGVQTAAEVRLASATKQSQILTAQIGKFASIQDLQSRIALGQAAVKVGGSTMIDWKTQIDHIQALMPAGYTVTAIDAAGATPMQDYLQATNALEPRRAATVTFTVTTPTIGNEFSTWLRELRSIPAYADATASTTSGDSGSTITLTVHLTAAAIDAADATETP